MKIVIFTYKYQWKMKNEENLNISDVSKRKFNLNELRHIAVNFAISCEKGYKGDFDSWFNGISGEWRKIANKKNE
jgi:hypothetical protein